MKTQPKILLYSPSQCAHARLPRRSDTEPIKFRRVSRSRGRIGPLARKLKFNAKVEAARGGSKGSKKKSDLRERSALSARRDTAEKNKRERDRYIRRIAWNSRDTQSCSASLQSKLITFVHYSSRQCAECVRHSPITFAINNDCGKTRIFCCLFIHLFAFGEWIVARSESARGKISARTVRHERHYSYPCSLCSVYREPLAIATIGC